MTLAAYANRPPYVLARLERLHRTAKDRCRRFGYCINTLGGDRCSICGRLLHDPPPVPPPRSPAAAYAGLSCGSPQAERAGVPFAEYLGRTLRAQHREDE